MKITIDPDSWKQGVQDGAKRKTPPAWSHGPSKGRGRDSYSYNSGYIEGDAFRQGYQVSMDVARIARTGSAIHKVNPKPASQITDRAKRYRAQRNRPPGPRRCNFCVSRKNIDLDHIDGDEADSSPRNLMYLCRSCNVSKGITQARNRIGVRTNQFNPQSKGARTAAQWRRAAQIVLGAQSGPVGAATALLQNTEPEKRVKFADEIERRNPFKSEAQRRKFYAMASRGEIPAATVRKFERETPPGTVNPEAPTYAQYAHGVSIHTRGAHDEGGAIIHATPPALRHRYAQQIARTKRQRRGTVPF